MSDHSSSLSRPASPVANLPATARPYRFTWDPPTGRRAGPASVSEATEGHADYTTARAPEELLNTSGAGVALGALPSDWSSTKHGFYAISTVLNHPHKRQAPPKAHSALPAAVPVDLPRVRRKDFDSYLRAVAPEWSRFESTSRPGRDSAAHLGGIAYRNGLMPLDTPQTPSWPICAGRSLPPLDSVPSVFFKYDFNLANPDTFDAVTERNSDSEVSADPSSLSHSLPLLEKFSHYADAVEQHLVQEVSLRSTSFFAALTNLRELQSESEQCLARIGTLRTLLKDIDEKTAKRGLEIVRKETRLRNLGIVRDGMKAINGWVEMTSVAKTLASAGQWSEALGVVDALEMHWSGKPTPAAQPVEPASDFRVGNGPFGLSPTVESDTASPKPRLELQSSSLRAFAALPTHLRDLIAEIAASLTSEVVSVLRLDLVARIDAPPGVPRDENPNLLLKDRLRPLLIGLVRTKGLDGAMLSWREVVMEEVRAVMKRRLPLLGEDGSGSNLQDSGASLSDHLQSMAYTQFLDLIRGVYSGLLNCVEGFQTQSGIFLDILSSIQSTHDPPVKTSIQEELTDILSSAAELSNTRAASVVTARFEQHAQLELPEFLEFFNESWSFVVKCEVICRRMIVGLRGVIVGQAKSFIQTFHQARISHSAKLVEDEQWSPTEVPAALQSAVDVVIDSAVRDPLELIIPSATTQFSQQHLNGSASDSQLSPLAIPASPSGSPAKSNGPTTSKQLRIEDRSYFTVSATAAVLHLLSDYLQVIVNLPMLTTDAMSKTIEFLKAFNSRTCQVVLGAGAMRSAGLKNITAKHLALASQSLSIMIALIPYVRETFRRHLSTKQAVILVEFDKLKRDYQEHQNEIHAKLIAIMGDRLTAHIQSLQGVQWDVPKVGEGVNDYMELLVKETVTLHKVLSRYLAVPIVQYVMTQVYAAINHRLSEEYARIELSTQEVKDRLLADAKYLHQKLSTLKNVGTPSGMLETIIAEKAITPTPTLAASTPSFRASALTANQRLKERLVNSIKAGSLMEKAFPLASPAESMKAPPIGSGLNGHEAEKTAVSPTAVPEEDKPGFKQVDPEAKRALEESAGTTQAEEVPVPQGTQGPDRLSAEKRNKETAEEGSPSQPQRDTAIWSE